MSQHPPNDTPHSQPPRPPAPRAQPPQGQPQLDLNGGPPTSPPSAPDAAPAEARDEAPFPYPKINWDEWPEWEDRLGQSPQAARPRPATAAPAPRPAAALTPAFTPRVEDELQLYHLHDALLSVHAELDSALPEARRQLAETLRYLEEKDPVRAELVRRCLKMAGYLVNEAAALLNEGLHWPTVEAVLCPPEEEFLDTPQNWLAVARARAENEPGASAPASPAPTEATSGAATPTWTAPRTAGSPPPAPSKAALRRLGRSLRSETEAEKRRFYAIAAEHGLATSAEARDAIFAALSELFGETITSHSQLNASKWSRAASAIETEDLRWPAVQPPLRIRRMELPKPTP